MLALVPAGVAADGGGAANVIPHVLRWTAAEDIDSLNPVLSQHGTATWLGRFTMAWLFRFDRDNRPIPELATALPTKQNGGISADGKTITLHLRRRVKWSDGAPFDADDVAFSLGVMNNPANNIASRQGYDRIVKIEEPDKATVVVHLREPYSPFLPLFAPAGGAPCVLPKHLLGGLPNINQAPYNELPVGIGPFRYTAWRRGDAVEMEANPYYWRGMPKLKEVIYKIIPDRNTALTQLQTGEIDLVYPLSGAFLDRARALPGITILRHPAFTINHFDFNLSHPALRETVVRQALRLATDRPTLRAKIGHGAGILQESVVPAPYPDVPKLPFVAYDPARANLLLDRAGWKRGPDGVRAKNGVRLSLEFATTSGSPDVDAQLELVRSWWQQIGVEMTIKRYDSALMFAPLASGGILYGGKFDVIAYGTGVAYPDQLSIAYGCDSVPPKGQNFPHYCNRALQPAFDDFLRQYDTAGQGRDLAQISATIAADVPTLVTSSREDIFAFKSSLVNFNPNNITPFDDMLDVDIQ